MGWVDIVFKVLQLLVTLAGIWKNGGTKPAHEFVSNLHKQACDEHCRVKALKNV